MRMSLKIPVAVGIISNAKGEILVAKRQSHQLLAGYWEFPGGKVEPNETARDALTRELNEELGITVLSAEPLVHIEHDYSDRIVLLDVWRVLTFDGEPYGREGQEVRWVDKATLNTLQLPLPNQKIVELL